MPQTAETFDHEPGVFEPDTYASRYGERVRPDILKTRLKAIFLDGIGLQASIYRRRQL
jgi:hypothetical protein